VGLRNPRIQRGDLVEHTKPPPLRVGRVYLVVRTAPGWIKLAGEGDEWVQASAYVVAYAGR
jgi:hypothetical protein